MPAQHVERRTHRDLCQFALELLDETDAIVLRHLAGGLTVKAKADATLVTQADTEVETRIRERIAAAFPDHGVLGEEFGSEAGEGGTRWIVDPIDGTHNLVRGIPVFGTLLAVEEEGELVVAAVSAPAMARRWWAVRGEGAVARDHLGERPHPRLHRRPPGGGAARLLGDRPAGAGGLRAGRPRLSTQAWRDRGFGEFWGYMLVAEGAADVMLEIGPTLWDLAAPALIVEEAGGRLTDFAGRHPTPVRRRWPPTGACTRRSWPPWQGSERGARALGRAADGPGADCAGHLHPHRAGGAGRAAGHRQPRLALAIDAVATLVAVAVAILGWVRFREGGDEAALWRASPCWCWGPSTRSWRRRPSWAWRRAWPLTGAARVSCRCGRA